MILVLPDAFTVYDGSMFSNSPTTGDWETFIAKDLIAYIDGHYRTIADRSARGLAGHSMGGYGTVRIGMKHPEAFSVLYAMSSCCLMNDPQRLVPGASANQPPSGALAHALSAQAAAWAPDTLNPPTYFDLPTKDGEIQPLIAAKWTANSPLLMVDQYVPGLKMYRAIAIDVGTKDPFLTTNTQLDQALTRLGVAHTFESYDGDHGNRITARFAAKVLPFFSANLTASEMKNRDDDLPEFSRLLTLFSITLCAQTDADRCSALNRVSIPDVEITSANTDACGSGRSGGRVRYPTTAWFAGRSTSASVLAASRSRLALRCGCP